MRLRALWREADDFDTPVLPPRSTTSCDYLSPLPQMHTWPQTESTIVDPYAHPSYEVQRGKLRDKQARDTAREAAAAQKAAK